MGLACVARVSGGVVCGEEGSGCEKVVDLCGVGGFAFPDNTAAYSGGILGLACGVGV